jgi:hypothetical protein
MYTPFEVMESPKSYHAYSAIFSDTFSLTIGSRRSKLKCFACEMKLKAKDNHNNRSQYGTDAV